MNLFEKESVNEDGVEFKQIEEVTTYNLKSKADYEKVVKKLNKQLGFEWHKVKEVTYPYVLVVDMLEEVERAEKKNKYHAINEEEYTQAYIEETKNQIKSLLKWIEKYPKARPSTCEKYFDKDIIRLEKLEDGYYLDMNYGNMLVTLARDSDNDGLLYIQGSVELYDDDCTGGSGEFHYDCDVVEKALKEEFNIDCYSVD